MQWPGNILYPSVRPRYMFFVIPGYTDIFESSCTTEIGLVAFATLRCYHALAPRGTVPLDHYRHCAVFPHHMCNHIDSTDERCVSILPPTNPESHVQHIVV